MCIVISLWNYLSKIILMKPIMYTFVDKYEKIWGISIFFNLENRWRLSVYLMMSVFMLNVWICMIEVPYIILI